MAKFDTAVTLRLLTLPATTAKHLSFTMRKGREEEGCDDVGSTIFFYL
jgi:hypothetical protein